LQGKVAIANGKLTYRRYKEIFSGADWSALAKKGAQTQRVLWASTSTKDPSYSDVLYVEELIGPDTVNTMPPQTLEAFRDHGKPKASLEADLDAAKQTMDTLATVGISMEKVTDDLVTQAVKLFAEPFDKLLNAVDAKCKFVAQAEVDAQTYTKTSAPSFPKPSTTGKWRVRCGVCGRAMRRSGPDRMKATGWAGSASQRISSRTSSTWKTSPKTSKQQGLSTRCCSAWADPACVPKF
jgi:transaldolase/glucose-6-phosphate isomerase